MVQSHVVRRFESTPCNQKTQEKTRNVKISKSSSKYRNPKDSQDSITGTTSLEQKKDSQVTKPSKNENETHEETGPIFIPLVEEIKQRRREERLAKEKQAKEDRERFVKEATERKAAEREETVKQAKRLILYRKPMCRRINRALLVSECYRELDAQMKFRDSIKNVDKEKEMAYVQLMKEDVAKYEEEKKQNEEKELEKQKNYAAVLKKQIEENERSTKTKEEEEFKAERQDQIDTNKYLQDMKEYEMQELLNKKQKLNQFFRDAIEEKKQFNLKLKYEDEFEDRAIEIYQNAKARIKKLHKAVTLRENEERERKAELITKQYQARMKSTEEEEQKILQNALEEQEAHYQEKERTRKERQERLRKELQILQMKVTISKSKQLQEEKDLKAWEMMQRFKKVEHDKDWKTEEQRRERNKKVEYGASLKKYIAENEVERKREKVLEDDNTNMKQMIEIENQRVLNYAEEVLNESKGVRPLYPILKAIQECKKEMGLVPVKKREEIVMDTVPKRRRRVPKCTKFVPEDKILYLQ